MSEQQHSLFNDDLVEPLLARIEDVPDDEFKTSWPEYLADLVDVFESRLTRLNISPARKIAKTLIAEQAHYLGGRFRYLPKGDKLLTALRNIDIFNDWYHGKSIKLIVQEHHELTEPQIYRIVQEQRKLHQKRSQRELF